MLPLPHIAFWKFEQQKWEEMLAKNPPPPCSQKPYETVRPNAYEEDPSTLELELTPLHFLIFFGSEPDLISYWLQDTRQKDLYWGLTQACCNNTFIF